MSGRITLFSDLHILKNPKPIYKDITKKWFEKFIEICKEENSKILCFLGDWHDNDRQIAVDDLHFSNECFSLLRDTFEKIYMIPGNHDCYFRNNSSINSISQFHDGIQTFVFNQTTNVEIKGIDVCFVPWGEEPSDADIILCHYDIQGFSLDNGKPSIHGKTKSDLFKHSSLILSGHYHRYQKKTYKTGQIMYLGSPFELSFGEEGKESYFWFLNPKDRNLEGVKNDWSPKHYNIFKAEDMENKEGHFVKIHDETLTETMDRSAYIDVVVNILETPIVSVAESLEEIDPDIDIPGAIDIVVTGSKIETQDIKEKTISKLNYYYETCRKK